MSPDTIRIASYNIRKARGLDQRRDPGRVLDIINDLGADIVVLQEADLRLGARKAAIPHWMIAAHSDYRIAPVARNEVSLGWHGNAVLLRPGITVEKITHIDLPALEPRGAVHLRLGGAAQVSVVAAHLGLRRRDRLAQQRAVAAHLGAGEPAIIAGDFNEWSERNGLEVFGARFAIHAPGRSFHALRPIAALDRIALSPEVSLYDAGVVEDQRARRASDHLPIWADLRIGPATGIADPTA